MSSFTRVAYIAKTRNLEGSVVAQSAGDLPFLLCENMMVYFVPPVLRGPRQACIAAVKQLKNDSYEVLFEGIDSIDEAEKIVGCYCLAANEDLPSFESIDEPQLLLGFEVNDVESGLLGEVEEVLMGCAQALLVVQGPYGEVMIPVVEEFLVDIDDVQRSITVDIPAGLIGMNGSESQA